MKKNVLAELSKQQAALRKELDVLHGQLGKGTPEEQEAKNKEFDKKLKESINIQKKIKKTDPKLWQ